MISLLDQDNHTVKMPLEDIAESLKIMGNPPGAYLFVHTSKAVENIPGAVLQIRPHIYPKYSWWQMLQKKWKGSRLLDRKIPVTFMGQINYIEEKGKSVWLRLKYDEQHMIYVD